MKAIIKHELMVQNKINNLIKYTAIFMIFCIFSVTLINPQENVQIFGIIFSVICIPLAFIGLTQGFVKADIEDGSLENSLVSIQTYKIVFAKYIALCICTLVSFTMLVPVIFILYDLRIENIITILFSGIMLITLSAALALLTSAVQGYFRTNTNFLSILIMPLIIPDIIISGLFIQAPENIYFATIMFGINMAIIPPSLYLSSYLLENIYNI
ncbi:MAG: heme exporter protein CcmB [Flavobacteriales bacterium]|nr:heme exporter protein CcmB [Flavobacteriales bacterium]